MVYCQWLPHSSEQTDSEDIFEDRNSAIRVRLHRLVHLCTTLMARGPVNPIPTVDIDPLISDAQWLHNLLQQHMRVRTEATMRESPPDGS
jgi:hypothetical protein